MAVDRLAFDITDRCHLDCQHCLRDPGRQPIDLPVGLFERVLVQAVGVYGTSRVTLTGGEPTLHPHFDAFLTAIEQRALRWNVVTTGLRFRKMVERLRRDRSLRNLLTAVNFSVDGATEATHDALRGAGSFRQVMEGIALAHMEQLPFSMNCTLHAGNESELEAFAGMAARLGAVRVLFNMMQPSGTLHDAKLFLPRRAWRRIRDRIEAMADMLRVPVHMTVGFEERGPFPSCDPMRSDVLHIDVFGRLNLCCQHSSVAPSNGIARDVVADLRSDSLLEGHRRLLHLIAETQSAKLRTLERAESATPWDNFPCNWCLAHFDRPHWTDDGAAGPSAQRQRWTGAWSVDKQQRRRLPMLAEGSSSPSPSPPTDRACD